MGENSKIEWTDHTFNPWIGCQEVSPACDHCYAKGQNAHRNWVNGWGPHGERRRTSATNWKDPLKWNREAEKTGRKRVFCASLADVFDNKVPTEWRYDLFNLIDATPHLDWLLLTKRPENMVKMMPQKVWRNVWLGVTVENQEQADRRIPLLLSVSAPVHFLSCEPLLGPLRVDDIAGPGGRVLKPLVGLTWRPSPEGVRVEGGKGPKIDWVICGGEANSAKSRPMHPDWARDLRDQCAAAGVPFLFKQWGDWAPGESADHAQTRTERVATWFDGEWHFGKQTPAEGAEGHRDDEPDLFRFGKKRAGRHLDGKTWDQFPLVIQ